MQKNKRLQNIKSIIAAILIIFGTAKTDAGQAVYEYNTDDRLERVIYNTGPVVKYTIAACDKSLPEII